MTFDINHCVNKKLISDGWHLNIVVKTMNQHFNRLVAPRLAAAVNPNLHVRVEGTVAQIFASLK